MTMKDGWVLDLLSRLRASKSNHHNLAVMVMFRLQQNYVNSFNILSHFILLHNQHPRGPAGIDVINYISIKLE
jgi:hypothetical protein